LETRSPFKSHGGLSRLQGALRYSASGLRIAWNEESAFRQELFICAVLIPIALIVPLDAIHKLLMIGSLVLVLVIELLNSAVEAVVDRVGVERHEMSKRAKDLGSAAVMIALILALATWITLLWPLFQQASR
jgi:diacylglycerol kinase (ATP)